MNFVKVNDKILEDNGDGTYTRWIGAGPYGAIGESGRLKSGLVVKPVTKKDAPEIERIRRMLERGARNSQIMYDIMKNHAK